MAVSSQFNTFVLDMLGTIRPVTSRRMFGGVGYYADGVFFALAHDDVLYFRIDEQTEPLYVGEGMTPFQPMGPKARPMRYYSLPARLYDDEEELGGWMDAALAAARAGAYKGNRHR